MVDYTQFINPAGEKMGLASRGDDVFAVCGDDMGLVGQVLSRFRCG